MSKEDIEEIELAEDSSEEELEAQEETLESAEDEELEEEMELDSDEGEDLELSDEEDDEELELSEEDDEDLELAEDDDEQLELSEEDDEDLELSEEDEDSIEIYDAAEREKQNQPDFKPLNLISKIEAIIFAAPKCMKIVDILEALDDESITPEQVKEQVDALMDQYAEREGGFRLESVRGHGYQFRTVPEAAPYMEKLFASRPRPLSRAALETLSLSLPIDNLYHVRISSLFVALTQEVL